jgi:DNA-binding CsgD family transcriptional regulator
MSLPEGELRLAQLLADQGNVRAALLWFEHEGDYVSIMRTASRLGALWVVSGQTQEGQHWLELGLERGSHAPDMVRATALATLSWTVNTRGHSSRAVALAEEGLAISRAWNEHITMVSCLLLIATPAYNLRKYDDAVARLEEAAAILSSLDETDLTQNMLVTTIVQLGQVALLQGNIAKAEALYRSALEQELGRGYAPGHSHVYGYSVPAGLGDIAYAKGDAATAFGHYRQVLGRYRNVRAIRYALGGISCALAVLGHHSTAARLFGALEATHISFGFRFELVTFEAQPAHRLPESWAVAYAPLARYHELNTVFGDQFALPPIPNPEAVAQQWAAGRLLTLDDAVSEALAVQIDARTSLPEPQSGLTSRELEVLQLLAEGKTDAEIAAALFISRRTAATHVRHIYDRLDVSSRAEAAVFAVRHRLV